MYFTSVSNFYHAETELKAWPKAFSMYVCMCEKKQKEPPVSS